MKIDNPAKRLKMFWGKVDQIHIEHIAKFVTGSKVLDMGAGYGTTSTYLQNKGYDVTAIDLDDESIKQALLINPNLNYQKLNAEDLPFENNSFDTLILRDALHHFIGEADFRKVKREMNRVLKPNGHLIFFDPNINLLLKTMRKLSGHIDEECSYEYALEVMNKLDYTIIHKSFNTLYSLPLSGGYVGINFVPNLEIVHKLILNSESLLEPLIQNKLGRFTAWRYLIVGKKE